MGLERSTKVLLALLALTVTNGGCDRLKGKGTGDPDTTGDNSPPPATTAPLPPGATPVAGDTATPTESTATPGPLSTAPASKGSVNGLALSNQDAPLSFAPIAKLADPSVVTINTIGEEEEPSGILSRRVRRRETKGLGTGFVIDKDGIIVTNNHVVAEDDKLADVITVKLSDERELPGKLIGRDAPTDIAVLRIDAKNLTPLKMGDSDGLEVGDWVVAIGNPFGLSHTVSAGIVSAKGRSREDVPLDPSGYYNFLQTDASINPGNSGGPLLNLRGEVVGVNTAIRGGGAQGIGFAIPVNMVKQILPMLLRDGHFTRSGLGISVHEVRELAPEDKQVLNITVDKGILVDALEPGGAADQAGLVAGDVIIAFEGTPLDRASQLQWLASTAGVGRAVTLRVSRAGKLFDVKATLQPLKSPAARQRNAQPRNFP